MSKNHLDTDHSLSLLRLGRQVYQLSQQAGQSFASYLSCLLHTHHLSQHPKCIVLLMNLNLLPQQSPSIILASTANSSPASHFSPLKKSFIFLLAVMELPHSLAWEMISQQACRPAAFHRWKGRIGCGGSVQGLCMWHCYIRICKVWVWSDLSLVISMFCFSQATN